MIEFFVLLLLFISWFYYYYFIFIFFYKGAIHAAVPLDARHCRHLSDPPAETEPCQGKCQSAQWQYDPWTQVIISFLFSPVTEDVSTIPIDPSRRSPKTLPILEKVQEIHLEDPLRRYRAIQSTQRSHPESSWKILFEKKNPNRFI